MPVTENLLFALRHLRQSESPRVVWVDAICINQVQTTERNLQVQIMDRVYSMAKNVVIWLGIETEGDKEVFELLAQFDGQDDAESDWETRDAEIWEQVAR